MHTTASLWALADSMDTSCLPACSKTLSASSWIADGAPNYNHGRETAEEELPHTKHSGTR